MEMTEKKNDLKSMMVESMEKVKEMVDANNIVGEPITTPDGVTLIPISRLSYGFGCGGGDYGKNKEHSGAGCGAGVRVEPMAFLVVKGGVTRMLPVGAPAITPWTGSSRWCRSCWTVSRASWIRSGTRISDTRQEDKQRGNRLRASCDEEGFL